MAAVSHWHLDHTLGSQELGTVPIWGTRRTREVMLERRSVLAAELARAAIEKEIRELETRRDALPTPGARADLEFLLGMNRALLPEVEDLRPTPPDRGFASRLTLPGDRGAELLSFGSAHTDADAVLHLPRDGVVFAGDLVVVGVQPSLASGNPGRWGAVLDEVERLGVERLVPGHGPVVTVEGVAEVRGYLAAVLETARSPYGSALPSALRKWEGSLSLDANVGFARAWSASHPESP